MTLALAKSQLHPPTNTLFPQDPLRDTSTTITSLCHHKGLAGKPLTCWPAITSEHWGSSVVCTVPLNTDGELETLPGLPALMRIVPASDQTSTHRKNKRQSYSLRHFFKIPGNFLKNLGHTENHKLHPQKQCLHVPIAFCHRLLMAPPTTGP